MATAVLGWLVIDSVRAATDQRAHDELDTVANSLMPTSLLQVGRIQAGEAPLRYGNQQRLGLANPAGVAALLSLGDVDLPLPVLSPLLDGLAVPDDPSSWAGQPARRVSSQAGDFWVAVRSLEAGAVLVVTVPTAFGDELVARVARTVFAVGVTVVCVSALLAWLFVRRSLRPLERLADAADRIGAGDLGRRAPDTPAASEVGRVSIAVNQMIDSLAHAVESTHALRLRSERFAADISHELRTPTTSILGYAQLGSSSGSWPMERTREMWQRVEAEALRLRDLTEQLLDLQRLSDPDAALPVPERFDVRALVATLASDALVIDPEHPVAVIEPGPVWVELPREPIVRIVNNLLANVRVHTPRGTRALVSVVRDGGMFWLRVSDDGPGIPADQRHAVFERLARAPGTSAPGSGLGLAIVAALVGRLGGRVEVVEAPGTCVEVQLPIQRGA